MAGNPTQLIVVTTIATHVSELLTEAAGVLPAMVNICLDQFPKQTYLHSPNSSTSPGSGKNAFESHGIGSDSGLLSFSRVAAAAIQAFVSWGATSSGLPCEGKPNMIS